MVKGGTRIVPTTLITLEHIYVYRYEGQWCDNQALELPTAVRVRLYVKKEEEIEESKTSKKGGKKDTSRPPAQAAQDKNKKKSKKQIQKEKEEQAQRLLDDRGTRECEVSDPANASGPPIVVTDFDICDQIEVSDQLLSLCMP